MPRVSTGPKLVLFARKKSGFTKYVWYIVWNDAGVSRQSSTGFEHFEAAKARETLAAFLNRKDAPRADQPSEMSIAECIKEYFGGA